MSRLAAVMGELAEAAAWWALVLAVVAGVGCAHRSSSSTSVAQEHESSASNVSATAVKQSTGTAATTTAKGAKTEWYRPDGSVRKRRTEGEQTDRRAQFGSVEAGSSSGSVTAARDAEKKDDRKTDVKPPAPASIANALGVSAFYAGLAGVLALLLVWWVRRRLTL